MKMCIHAKFCGKRMALGDRINGCSSLDEQTCSPSMSITSPTPTAPEAPDVPLTLLERDIGKGRQS